MFNAVEIATVVVSVAVATAFFFESRIRRQGHSLAARCIHLSGILWWCMLIFGQPYVRPSIRVAVGSLALIVIIKVIYSMLTERQSRRA